MAYCVRYVQCVRLRVQQWSLLVLTGESIQRSVTTDHSCWKYILNTSPLKSDDKLKALRSREEIHVLRVFCRGRGEILIRFPIIHLI